MFFIFLFVKIIIKYLIQEYIANFEKARPNYINNFGYVLKNTTFTKQKAIIWHKFQKTCT